MSQNANVIYESSLMQIHGLGVHSDKIWADSMYYQKYPRIPQNLVGRSTHSTKIFASLQKKPSLGANTYLEVLNTVKLRAGARLC